MCKGFSDIQDKFRNLYRPDYENNLHDFSNLTIKAKIMQDRLKKFIVSGPTVYLYLLV